MRRADETDLFLQLPDNVLISVVTILCFNGADEASIDDCTFALQYVCKRFYAICNSKALWKNKPIILSSGRFNDGAFKLIKKKTQGTEGICYHAYCRPHRREYAVKRVSRVSPENEGVPYYMLRVLSALRNLKHPGINELLYVSLAGSRLYTIYPYIELTLQDIIFTVQNFTSIEELRGSALAISALSSPLKQHVAIDLMAQLMSAISYLHGRGILHRNLKPKHILIIPAPNPSAGSDYMEGATLKISDFALARTLFHPPRDLTAEVITLWFRPPEILLGDRKYTSAVDVWSAGCIFAEMLEGRPLFAGLSQIDQLFQIFSRLGSPGEGSSFRCLPFYQEGIFPQWDKNLLRHSMRSLQHMECDPDAKSPSARNTRERSDECLDLLGRCFLFEPSTRITAAEAMRHPCLLSRSPASAAPDVDSIGISSSDISSISAGIVDPDVAAHLETLPPSVLQQLAFLRELESASGNDCRSKVPVPRRHRFTRISELMDWSMAYYSQEFAVVDWMIKISDGFSEFTCMRTVFLAVALMDRFRRHDGAGTSSATSTAASSATSSGASSGGCGSSRGSCTVSGDEEEAGDISKKGERATQEASVSLKLLGATCLHVASKLEDVSYLGVRDLVLLMVDVGTDGPCALTDMLQLEVYLLNHTAFNLYLATIIDFLHIYFECVPGLKDAPAVQHLCKYMGELTLLFSDQFSGKFLPSLMATAIVCYSMAYNGIRYDEHILEYLSKYRLCDTCKCLDFLYIAHGEIAKKHRHSAVYRRYDSHVFLNVSVLPSMSLPVLHTMLAELRNTVLHTVGTAI